MIINDEAAQRRLNSPFNLINKLKDASNGNSRKNAMSLFGVGREREQIERVQPLKQVEDYKKIDDLVKSNFNPFDKPSSLVPAEIPVKETQLDDILENHDAQIKLGLAHDKALDLLSRSVEVLSTKLDDVSASKLPQVITAASKVVESIRRERNENAKNNKDREVHFHFYTPEQKKVSDYEVIDVA